jgi:hypothetical protein
MNRDQSYSLIRQTFTQGFDKARFQNFAVNLLNWIDESKAQGWNSTYVKDAFKDHVNRYERLGTYTTPDNDKLDVLIVHLTSETKLARARTAIRNFVAHHLKTRDEKDAALVAFVSPTEKQWRLSYVKMEYATVEKESGKACPERSRRIGVETRLTPARRFSYIVGEGESCHTAQTRFLPLLQDTITDPKLADIEEAFSVEAVTKEFFKRYVELFENIHLALDRIIKKDKSIHEEFQSRNVNTVDFAKKLMGQIVFLYFLQKKGWLGVEKGKDWGTGPHDFLRRLAAGEYSKYDNYFNDILEPLFYDTLAIDRGHEAWCKSFNCRIPFLNGGLFEPLGGYDWRKTDIIIPNRLFTNDDQIEEGVTGSGVLDVFDRYNFTVNEAEPLEKEVAIDPEMLGKVFENLIEENRRKGLGAYYTPREIVHYMCRESLINYLDSTLNRSEEPIVAVKPRQNEMFGEPKPEQMALGTVIRRNLVSLEDIAVFVKLGDQASHYETARMSGTKSYKAELPKGIEKHARLIDDKLKDITICDPAVGSGAFPVGMMTEIVRARSALTPYFNDIHERTPYFFKRHAIQNCLYGVDIDPGAVEIAKLRLWLSLVVDEEDVKQVRPLPNLDYKIMSGNSLFGVEKDLFNAEAFKQLELLKPRFFDETDDVRKKIIKDQIDRLIVELTNGEKQFDFEIMFSEVFHKTQGFDAVIANPPYVRQESIKAFKPQLKKAFGGFYCGTADLYTYFYKRGLEILKPAGHLCFIAPNKFMRAGYGRNTRALLASEATPKIVIDFGDLPIFDATTYPSILLVEKGKPEAAGKTLVATFTDPSQLERLDETLAAVGFSMPTAALKPEGWTLERPDVLALMEKLRKAGKPLGEYVEGRFYRGVLTGLNEAFVIDEATRKRLIAEDPKSADLIKPWLRGRDIQKWKAEWAGLYLIAIASSANREWPWSKEKSEANARPLFADAYPAIHRHLSQYEHKLRIRDDQGKCWWELRSCVYYDEFDKSKIIYPNITKTNIFAYDTTGVLTNQKCFIIPTTDIYLVAILNSKLATQWFHSTLPLLRGGFFEPSAIFMEHFPVFPAADAQKAPIIERVQKILADPESPAVPGLEEEIDKLVYELYGLTADEVGIVERKQ